MTVNELEFQVLLKPCLISPPFVCQVNVGKGFEEAVHTSVVEFPLINSTDTCFVGINICGASKYKLNSKSQLKKADRLLRLLTYSVKVVKALQWIFPDSFLECTTLFTE